LDNGPKRKKMDLRFWKRQRRQKYAYVKDNKMVIKMAVVLITMMIEVLMISCNNYDERDTNSDDNSYTISDKRIVCICPGGSLEHQLMCRARERFCASAKRNHGHSTDISHLCSFVLTQKA
jgi:hypothetical protein